MSWLQSKTELVAAIGAAGFFAVSAGALGFQLIGAHGQIKAGIAAYDKLGKVHAATVKDLETCHLSEANLQVSLATQNEAVTAWKAQADAKGREADLAVQQARRQADGYRKAAAGIVTRPEPSGDRCVAAADLLRGTLESLP
jgi:hypothetical protein